MGDGADTTDIPTDTDTVTWENALLMLNPKPKLPLKLMPLLMLTTDITDTHMLMDMAVTMVDTTDTPTVTSERDLLMLNLKPNPKLMPPLVRILRWILRLSLQIRICSSLRILWPLLVVNYSLGIAILSKLAKFCPPFELSKYHQLLPLKTLKYLIFFKTKKFFRKHPIWTKRNFSVF